MEIQKYYKNQFMQDIKSINLEKPNQTVQNSPEHFGVDENTFFFGGKDWANLSKDIANVEKENRENFCLCLFSMVSIDLTLHTYFKEAYPAFRDKTNSIKFGWSGFGPHFESPSKLLSIPQQKQVVDFNTTAAAVEEFVDFFIGACEDALSLSAAEIDVNDFIGKLITDKQYRVGSDSGSMFEAIHKCLELRI